MEIVEVVKKAKRHYDEQRLKRVSECCKFPPGCQARMRLGTGILEIVCKTEDLVGHVWCNYREYFPVEILTMERLWIGIEGEDYQEPISIELLLKTRKLREDADRFRKENLENQ